MQGKEHDDRLCLPAFAAALSRDRSQGFLSLFFHRARKKRITSLLEMTRIGTDVCRMKGLYLFCLQQRLTAFLGKLPSVW